MRTPPDEPNKSVRPRSQPGPTPDDFDYTSDDAARRFDLQDTRSDRPAEAKLVPYWLVLVLIWVLVLGGFWVGYEWAIYSGAAGE